MLTHNHKGRLWQEVGREPYTRVDGTETELIRWRLACAKCGEGFEIKTTAWSNYRDSKAFGAVHCPMHKLTKAEVSARAIAARRAKRGAKC